MKKLLKFRYVIYATLFVTGIAIMQSCAVDRVYTSQMVTVPDIVQMSKDGLSSKDIIKEIKKSHTVYSLKADQMVKLRDQGVQDSVLNYMEEAKIKAIRRDQRYADSNYWPIGPGGYYYGSFGWGWPYGYYGWGFGPSIVFDINRGYGGGYHAYHHEIEGSHEGRRR